MTDRPILFSAPMIRALLEGRKTQTRRLAWRVHGSCSKCGRSGRIYSAGKFIQCPQCEGTGRRPTIWQKIKPGDRLWVRETWGTDDSAQDLSPPSQLCHFDHVGLMYRATDRCLFTRWRPSIHMPRWASRLTLCVTDVRRERVREISEGDAVSEGSLCLPLTSLAAGARGAFTEIWNTIHGPDAWDRNDEVVALTFTVHKANIDQLGEQAA